MYNEVSNLIKGLIGCRFSGECNRCGECCEVYESDGKGTRIPCRHLAYETIIEDGEERKVAFCNPYTLVGGYFGRPLACAIYPLQEESELPEKCSYEVIRG